MQRESLAAVIDVLRAAGVEPVLLKGLAAARYYADPSLRPGGDLDFWVHPREIAAARLALRTAGFAQAYDIGISEPNPNTFVDPSGVSIDLKTRFKGVSPALLRRWWHRAVWAEIGDRAVRVLAPGDDLVYLSNHATRHVYRAAKWLLDIAAILNQWRVDDWGCVELPDTQPARSWSLVTLGLALDLLDADRRALSPTMLSAARRAAAPWQRRVLTVWGGAPAEAGSISLVHLRERLLNQPTAAEAWRALKDLWPGPMEAAVYLQVPLQPSVAERARYAAFARRRLWAPFSNLRVHRATLGGRVHT